MLQAYQEKDLIAVEKKLPFPSSLKLVQQWYNCMYYNVCMSFLWYSPHKQAAIVQITALPIINRGSHITERATDEERKDSNIVTVSKDGIICFWNSKSASNLRLYKTVNVCSLKY